MKIDIYQSIAIQAAQLSGEVIKKYFRNLTDIEIKADESPVTIADKVSEELIRQCIRKNFPNHGIIGEEFGEENPEAEFKWVIDPIDGTKSYVSGFFDFGTIIGLLYQDQPILGLIHQPVLNEIIIGDNQIATLNGKPISVRKNNDLTQATLLTTDYATLPNLEQFNQLAQQVKQIRTWGNCYGHVMVAMGYADIMVDPVMKLWDIVGITPIIKGAGGFVSDYQGQNPLRSNSLLSFASKSLQDSVVKHLTNIQEKQEQPTSKIDYFKEDVVIDESGNEEIIGQITSKLKAYNESKVGPYGRKPFVIYMRSQSDEVIAGISGHILGNLCAIHLMFVDEEYRRQRLGTKILRALENYAKNKHCQIIQLDTAEFQAKGFYEKFGFITVATLNEGFMKHSQYIMRKLI